MKQHIKNAGKLPLIALTVGLLTTGTSALAQREIMLPAIQMGGAMHAIARACGGYSEADLQRRKAAQKASALSNGISGAEFEAQFKSAHDKTKTQYDAGTAAQKTQACQQYRAMAAQR